MKTDMKYEIVIGLEVHNELKTNSKIFCSCKNEFTSEPNVNCCPICIGMPGTLPVLNKKALEYIIRAGLAHHCEINKHCVWDRKHYYYPDLSKAYQISQLDFPVCKGGYVEVGPDGNRRKIRLNRIHLEEDAGKLVHSDMLGTLVDYNRGGVPLIEIVSEPDLRSADEAIEFLEALKTVSKYIGISDCKMEQGSLRCDVNVSLNKPGEPYGTRTEMKNIASFKAVHKAIHYEVKRQAEILDNGGVIVQETRRWDDAKGKSFTMRTKEDAQDYRYFPDPDLAPVNISAEFIERIRATLPELPAMREKRYVTQYGLPAYDAKILTSVKELADFFEEAVKEYNNPKAVSNWIMTEIMRRLKDSQSEDIVLPVGANSFGAMLKLLDENVINQHGAKKILDYLWDTDGSANPSKLIEQLGLSQITDTSELESVLKGIIDASPAAVSDYRSGNAKTMAFFVGQAMKATKGKANPQIVNELIKKLLD